MATRKSSSKSVPAKAPAAVRKSASAKRESVRTPPMPAPASKRTESVQPAVPVKPRKKLKLVRDSFTMPKDDYLRLAELKTRSAAAGHLVKKSEVLRAGLAVLWQMNDAALASALASVPRLVTGRPKGTRTTDKPGGGKKPAAS